MLPSQLFEFLVFLHGKMTALSLNSFSWCWRDSFPFPLIIFKYRHIWYWFTERCHAVQSQVISVQKHSNLKYSRHICKNHLHRITWYNVCHILSSFYDIAVISLCLCCPLVHFHNLCFVFSLSFSRCIEWLAVCCLKVTNIQFKWPSFA